ncbi:MAG TPA: hypothetical protein VFX76_10700, partial [Roseiflexaceae bacterium]|nr:hypothetical protein [Roseiflexaceae bacterium]
FLSTDSTAQSKVDAERKTSITKAISDTINPLIDPATLQVTVAYTATTVTPAYHAYRSGDMLDVTLIHEHPLFFGLFGSQKLTLKASSEMRIEPGDAR